LKVERHRGERADHRPVHTSVTPEDFAVTTAWLAQALHHWMSSWRDCERQLRRAAAPAKRHRTLPQAELIH
jgi:hypothetical protein